MLVILNEIIDKNHHRTFSSKNRNILKQGFLIFSIKPENGLRGWIATGLFVFPYLIEHQMSYVSVSQPMRRGIF
jgi:hypothetical protein